MADDNGFSIDLNEKHTRMAEVKASGNSLELIALGYEETVPLFYVAENQGVVEKQAEIIANLYKNLKIKKRNARVIIPDMYTYSRVMEMPRLKEKELLSAIRYQADEFIPMAIEDTNLDLEILKEDEKNNKMSIFIVASPKKIVQQIQQTIELADLIPYSLENELSAVARLTSTFFKNVDSTKTGTSILINFGYSNSSLYLFDSSTSLLLLSRNFKIGLNLFIKDITANLNMDEAKALEVLQTIGANQNTSISIDPIISPLIKEIAKEIERFILISKDKYALPVTELSIFNYDNAIAAIHTKMQESLSLPITSLTMDQHLVNNPIKQSFSNNVSSFVSVIAGNI